MDKIRHLDIEEFELVGSSILLFLENSFPEEYQPPVVDESRRLDIKNLTVGGFRQCYVLLVPQLANAFYFGVFSKAAPLDQECKDV